MAAGGQCIVIPESDVLTNDRTGTRARADLSSILWLLHRPGGLDTRRNSRDAVDTLCHQTPRAVPSLPRAWLRSGAADDSRRRGLTSRGNATPATKNGQSRQPSRRCGIAGTSGLTVAKPRAGTDVRRQTVSEAYWSERRRRLRGEPALSRVRRRSSNSMTAG